MAFKRKLARRRSRSAHVSVDNQLIPCEIVRSSGNYVLLRKAGVGYARAEVDFDREPGKITPAPNRKP